MNWWSKSHFQLSQLSVLSDNQKEYDQKVRVSWNRGDIAVRISPQPQSGIAIAMVSDPMRDLLLTAIKMINFTKQN